MLTPFRWSKTLSAYNNWAFIFEKDLPMEIETEQSALTVIAYIRDVIAYAHENNLKGSHWYKKVTVSAVAGNKIFIRSKRSVVTVTTYPTKSIFELLEQHQSIGLDIGYKFYSTETNEEIAELFTSLGVNFRLLEQNLMEIIE